MADLNNNLPNEEKVNIGETEESSAHNTPDSIPSNSKKTSFIKELIAQAELIVIAFSIIILVFSFVARTSRVEGTSMENTMYHNEFVLISNLFYTPEKEDIIVFHQTGYKFNEPIVKRVIGLPGDTVKIEYFGDSSMKVTVTDKDGNTEVLQEDYIKCVDSRPAAYNNRTIYVEEGTVFVMGDNRNNSADSRDINIGLVDQRRILGKVVLRLFPISRFGTVE